MSDKPKLLSCEVCDGKVASNAKACPHCGAPNTQALPAEDEPPPIEDEPPPAEDEPVAPQNEASQTPERQWFTEARGRFARCHGCGAEWTVSDSKPACTWCSNSIESIMRHWDAEMVGKSCECNACGKEWIVAESEPACPDCGNTVHACIAHSITLKQQQQQQPINEDEDDEDNTRTAPEKAREAPAIVCRCSVARSCINNHELVRSTGGLLNMNNTIACVRKYCPGSDGYYVFFEDQCR